MTDAGVKRMPRPPDESVTPEIRHALAVATAFIRSPETGSDGASLLRAILDQLPDQIYIKDRQARFVFANRATLDANRIAKPEHLLGKTDVDLHGSVRAADFLQVEQDIMERAEARFDIEETVVRPDGEKAWLLISKIPLKDVNGAVTGLIGISRDITMRRREEAIRSGQAALLEMIARSEPLADILSSLVRLAESQLHGLRVSVLLMDAEGKRLRAGAAPSLPSAYNALTDGLSIGPKAGSCGTAAWLGQPVIVSDILTDERWECCRGVAEEYGFRACWSTPVLSKQGGVLGTVALYGTSVREPTAEETALIAMATHIASIAIERQQAEDRMQFMAHHDPLTGLPNRAFFKERVAHMLQQARTTGKRVVLVYADLDNFKQINDRLGHGAGDEVLRQAASRMLEFTRASDLVARVGGDEFLLVFANQSRAELDILPRLQQLRAKLSQPVTMADAGIAVTCSMGVARFPEDGDSVEMLIANADAAMYAAKQSGRDALQSFSQRNRPPEPAETDGREELREAIANHQLFLQYQPQIDVESGRVLGVEALVRWAHPRLGLQMPDRFIPLAESTGLILPLGLWVLKAACRQSRLWQDLGLAPVMMAVNVSARQFCDPALPGQVREALEESGLDPALLELELTEDTVMRDTAQALKAMQALSALGVRLSIDDFGTGYSNFAALKTLPVSRLKMDRSFIESLPHDTASSAIASAVIALAQKLKLSVIAEGVETDAQLQYLRSTGCQEVQGFHFSRPVDAAGIEDLLRQTADDKGVRPPLVLAELPAT